MVNKDERGLAHVAMLVLVVIVIGAIGGVGYYVMSKQKKTSTKTSGNTNQPVATVANKAAEDECNKDIKDKDFCKFVGKWDGLKQYKATLTSSSDDGSYVMKIEAENSARSRVTTSLNGVDTAAYVTIDNSSYTKDYADGKWTKNTVEKTPDTKSVEDDIKFDFKDDPATPEKEDQIKYNKIGKEACGKLTCFKFQIVDPANSNTEQFIWFDDDDYLLRQWSTKDENGTSVMVISYDKVTITAPTPLK